MRLAVCVAVIGLEFDVDANHTLVSGIRNANHIVLVARRTDPNNWNLPGGKVDNGETLEQAAVRELREETGIEVEADQLHRAFVDTIDDFVVVTYVIYHVLATTGGLPELYPAEGEPPARWGTWDDLLNEGSVFHKYNRKLYCHLQAENRIP